MKKLLFVFNPHAGKGQIKDNLCDIVDIFTKGGYEVVTYPTQAKLDGYNKLCKCGQDYDMIVTSGGDGTLSEAVKAMMTFDKKIPLGYIPAGSTNDCAQSLSIPKKMLDAAREIVDGVYFDYDVGKFNGQYFVYVAGFGAFTDVSYETSQTLKNKFGHAAYVAEGIKRLSKITGQQMRVEHDGEVVEGSFILGLISNTISVGGMKKLIASGVCFDDGLFEVTLIKTPKNPIALQEIIAALLIEQVDTKHMYTFKTKKITFDSVEEIPWTLDGEFGGEQDYVEIENVQKAMEIMVPENHVLELSEQKNKIERD